MTCSSSCVTAVQEELDTKVMLFLCKTRSFEKRMSTNYYCIIISSPPASCGTGHSGVLCAVYTDVYTVCRIQEQDGSS